MVDFGEGYEPKDDPSSRLSRREVRGQLEELETLREDYTKILNESKQTVKAEVGELYNEFLEILEEAESRYGELDTESLVKEYAPQIEQIRHQMEKVLTFETTEAGGLHNHWEERHAEKMIEEFQNKKSRLRRVAENHGRMSSDAKDFGGGSSTIRDKIREQNWLFNISTADYQKLINRQKEISGVRNNLPQVLENKEEYWDPERNHWEEEEIKQNIERSLSDEERELLEDITGALDRDDREPGNVEDTRFGGR